uniref:Putative phosphatidylinositol 4-kinase STT4-like protein n=1 Tax=Lygus hesperus TaxID=30085 RepID=A0A0A9YZ26_LYGHE
MTLPSFHAYSVNETSSNHDYGGHSKSYKCQKSTPIPTTITTTTTTSATPMLVQKKDSSTEMLTARKCLTATIVKACIFKMGDDCRQDQLSLQLIGFMKRILDIAHVPVFLYPYRVVTTGHGSGIIECVPRSMSRNEIGQLV